MGREHELERIDAALDALDGDGAPGCVAIEGEPGIGKSRLLAELRERAEERGHIVLHGQAAEFERDRPFGVLVETRRPLPRAPSSKTASAPPRSSCARSWRRSSRRCAAPAAAPATIGDERYRSHRAVRSLLELLAGAEAAGDRRSTTCTGATRRRSSCSGRCCARPADAPVLLVLAFRPGSAPPAAGRGAGGAADDQARARPAQRGGGGGAARPTSTPTRARRSTATAAATPSTWSSWRGSSSRCASTRAGRRRSRARSRPGSPPRWRRSSAALSADARALLEAAAVAGEPFDPGVAGEIAELDQAAALERPRRAARPRAGPPHRRAAALHLPPPAGPPQRLRVDRRRLEAGRPLARRRQPRRARSGGRRARPPRRAGGRTTATRRRSRSCSRLPPRPPDGRRRWRRAGWKGRCGCCSTATASARSRSGWRSPRPCARSASWSAAARCCWRRSRWSATATSRGGCELTAWCAAVEHWLGRPRGRAQAPAARLGGARRPRDGRERGAADRARGRRPLHARLRADADDGRGRARAARGRWTSRR